MKTYKEGERDKVYLTSVPISQHQSGGSRVAGRRSNPDPLNDPMNQHHRRVHRVITSNEAEDINN